MLGTFLSALCRLIHLILLITLEGRCYYYLCLTEVKKLVLPMQLWSGRARIRTRAVWPQRPCSWPLYQTSGENTGLGVGPVWVPGVALSLWGVRGSHVAGTISTPADIDTSTYFWAGTLWGREYREAPSRRSVYSMVTIITIIIQYYYRFQSLLFELFKVIVP